MKYRWWEMHMGWRGPQVKIQITPLCWGYGAGIGPWRASLRVGPIAVAFWFHPGEFDFHQSSTNGDIYETREREHAN